MADVYDEIRVQPSSVVDSGRDLAMCHHDWRYERDQCEKVVEWGARLRTRAEAATTRVTQRHALLSIAKLAVLQIAQLDREEIANA